MSQLRLTDKQLEDFASVAQALDDNGIWWAAFAGTAAVYYGSARGITDIDVILRDRRDAKLAYAALELMRPTKEGERRRGIFRMFSFSADLPSMSFDFATDIIINVGGSEYPFFVDTTMQNRAKTVELHKGGQSTVKMRVLSPEDIIVFKAICQRGIAEGKYDLQDAQAIIEKQRIDWRYIEERARRCNAYERVFSVLPISRR
jgi:hypothetical protein